MQGVADPAPTIEDHRRSPLGEANDPPVGTHAILFASGFLIALAYLGARHRFSSYPSIFEMSPPSVLWAALFCTQVGAWAAVGTWAAVTAKPMLSRVDTASGKVIGAALALLVAFCLVFFDVFIGRSVNAAGIEPGISTRIAGLGPFWAAVSYSVVVVLAGALLITHAALQQSNVTALTMREQMRTLRQFSSRLRTQLFGAGLLVGLSSASAVALNRARGSNGLPADYLVIHGALYSILLALLYVPAHITLVKKARTIVDRLPAVSPAGDTTAPDERKQIEEDLGLRLSGLPGWDIVASILVPLAASFLGK
jgi:hypothetical protein